MPDLNIKDPEYFFTNYVGYTPDDASKVRKTNEMIHHYVESSMEDWLPKIYETCARDEVLDTENVPKNLWKDGNLLEDAFYMHPILTIRNQAPQLDPYSGMIYETSYYRENIEYFSIDDLLAYAYNSLQHESAIERKKEDRGAAFHLLKRYSSLKKENIQPLDMVLFLVTANRGEHMKLIQVAEKEDEVLGTIRSYKKKLEDMGQYHVTWRGSLG